MFDADHNVRVGKRLRDARKAAGLSASQVAKRLSMSDSGVRAWENGQNAISAEVAAKLSPIVKCPAGWILFGEGEPGLPPATERAARLLSGRPEPEQERIVAAIESLLRTGTEG